MHEHTRKLVITPGVYAYVGDLPQGCKLCIQGTKMVIFITGVCHDKCFYCPVSRERFGKPVAYADEEPVHKLEDLVDEALRIGADGASITGGDPLVALDRTIRAIKLLKELFGETFHIHLYTSGRYATASVLRELERAGLDEIRFHPTAPWLLKRIETAVKVLGRTRMGVEVPVLPDKVDELRSLIKWLDEIGVEFINLNEAEVSPSNIVELMKRGYRVHRGAPVVLGSEEAAIELVKWALENTKRITVHYCPARYKDKVQMRIRLLRKALRVSKPYEEYDLQGMLRAKRVPVNPEYLRLVEEGYGEVIDGYVVFTPRLPISGEEIKRYPTKMHSLLPLEKG